MEKVRLNEYILQDPKLIRERCVVNISDIHGNIRVLESIKEVLKCIPIDYLCISGDVLDNAEDKNKELLLDLLKQLGNTIETFVALGNHDLFRYGSKREEISVPIPLFFEELEKNTKCNVLGSDFQSCKVDRDISINALNMPHEYFKTHESLDYFSNFISSIDPKIDENTFNILLSHSPNSIIKNNVLGQDIEIINKMQLILSGHNHGGLTPVMIQNISKNHYGIVGPYAKVLQPNAFGYWTTEGTSLVLSNGVTKVSETSEISLLSKMLNKFFIPDIDVIHIEPGDKHDLVLVKRNICKY